MIYLLIKNHKSETGFITKNEDSAISDPDQEMIFFM